MKNFFKRLLTMAASGAAVAGLDALHQMTQGYSVSDDWGHIGAAAGAGALVSVVHLLVGTPGTIAAPAPGELPPAVKVGF
jgi:hypothetical protein